MDRRPQALAGTVPRPTAFEEDQSNFLFHGSAVASRALAQPGFHAIVEIADRDACHRHVLRSCLAKAYAVLAMQSSDESGSPVRQRYAPARFWDSR